MMTDCTATAAAPAAESPESIQKKIEETRGRFRSEYVQESSDKYEARDLERLWCDDVLVDSYLEWWHYDVEETLKMIAESFQWRKDLCVNDIDESSVSKQLMESGMHYLHGFDKKGNTLFWFRMKLLVQDVGGPQEKRTYVAYWLESFIRREPGALLTVVFDMTDSGLSNVDMDFMKYFINCFQVYYPRLLHKIYVYEAPWIMNAAWMIVKGWLDQEAIDLLEFVSKTDILTYVDPEHLPFHMGGTDSFAYSYPPLPEDVLQLPVSTKPSPDEEITTSASVY